MWYPAEANVHPAIHSCDLTNTYMTANLKDKDHPPQQKPLLQVMCTYKLTDFCLLHLKVKLPFQILPLPLQTI